MCGIAGFWDQGARLATDERAAALARMTQAIRHRGPDDHGSWFDAPRGPALGHRRLSIIDLSPAGHQPMASADERLRIVFNGEIYNFPALRTELEALGAGPWRGHSDTEVLLAAIRHWGVAGALQRAHGMFALALWDAHEQTLTLARDRLGEKPLYFGWRGATLVFASELKAIAAFDRDAARPDPVAVAGYLKYGYVPAPRSALEGIGSVPAAHFMAIRAGRSTAPATAYWRLDDATRRPAGGKLERVDKGTLDALDALLRDAVARQMVADVPLGAFLSGGIDSSTVVALMQAQSPRPVKTFTIGFHEAGYDEAPHARAVAHHLGTEHTELYVTARDLLDTIPELPHVADGPFADASLLPTLLVSRLARSQVTVSLSGDGGDELFAGYARYRTATRTATLLRNAPRPLRRAAAQTLAALGPTPWNALGHVLAPVLPPAWRGAGLGDRIGKAAELLGLDGLPGINRRMVSQWPDPSEILIDAPHVESPIEDAARYAGFDSGYEAMMALDLATYLPDDLLVKVDRAAMAVSLESRVPFLDHRVVEFAWRLPIAAQIGPTGTKRVLRALLRRYVPDALVDRPKMGFGLPMGDWLRGPLRDWAEDLLSERRLRFEGIFRVEAVRSTWTEHVEGRRNWQYRLWCLLMFLAWRGSAPGR